MRAWQAILALSLPLLATVVPMAGALYTPTEYAITVSDQVISVSMTQSLSQNITAFKTAFRLPQVNATLEGTNSTAASEAVQNALRATTSTAQVANFRLQTQTTAWSDAISLQRLNISLSMDITGIPVSRAGVVQVDMAWKSFAVPSDVTVDGVEVNNVGNRLLLGVAQDLAQVAPNATRVSFFYFVKDTEVGRAFFPTAVSRLSTLNFSSFAPLLSEWRTKHVALEETNTWTLEPQASWGMRIVEQIQEATVERITYGIWSIMTGRVTTNSAFSVRGDSLTLFTDSSSETIMGSIILSVSVVGVGLSIYERRILKAPTRKRVKR